MHRLTADQVHLPTTTLGTFKLGFEALEGEEQTAWSLDCALPQSYTADRGYSCAILRCPSGSFRNSNYPGLLSRYTQHGPEWCGQLTWLVCRYAHGIDSRIKYSAVEFDYSVATTSLNYSVHVSTASTTVPDSVSSASAPWLLPMTAYTGQAMLYPTSKCSTIKCAISHSQCMQASLMAPPAVQQIMCK